LRRFLCNLPRRTDFAKGFSMRKTIVLVATAATFFALPALADDCASMLNTMVAHVGTPYSATMVTQTPGAAAKTMKTVSAGGMMYVQMPDGWKSMAMDPKETADMMRKAAATAKETCHRAGDEMMGGEMSAVYIAHVENQGNVSDNKVWISKSRNLVMKTDVQMKSGDHISMTFDYAHVTPPAGAKPVGAK
jgi:hypothetical protein